MTAIVSITDETAFAEFCVAHVITQGLNAGFHPALLCIESFKVIVANPVCYPPRRFAEIKIFSGNENGEVRF